MRVVWVFLAGGLGSVARFAVGVASAGVFGTTLLPVGTLTVNFAGSFLIAVLAELALSTGRVSPELRLVLATGFLGGFTTYSAFANESFTYLRDGLFGLGLGYVALTVVGCLVMCLLGQLVARAFLAS